MGIFELKPPKMKNSSPGKRFSGRCNSWCQCLQGKAVGLVLEELRGSGGAGRDRGQVSCGGWKRLDHCYAGLYALVRLHGSYLSTLKTIKRWLSDIET